MDLRHAYWQPKSSLLAKARQEKDPSKIPNKEHAHGHDTYDKT